MGQERFEKQMSQARSIRSQQSSGHRSEARNPIQPRPRKDLQVTNTTLVAESSKTNKMIQPGQVFHFLELKRDWLMGDISLRKQFSWRVKFDGFLN
jgi:hypothetical protein